MSKRVAVLGSELDGLVAALALAERGNDVLLVEEGDSLGGTAAAVEIAPGYRAPLVLDRGRLRADLLRQLKIPADQLAPPPVSLQPVDDGTLRTPGEAPEAAAWIRQVAELSSWARRITHRPAPPLDPRCDWKQALATGVMTRMLGKRRLHRLLRVGSLPIADWLTESMHDGRLAAALAAPALEGTAAGPMAMGTGLQSLLRSGATGARAARGLPALIDVLAEPSLERGVDHRRGVPLKGVHSVGGDWILHLESGEAIEVDAVVNALPPRRLFLELLDDGLPIEMVDSLRNFRSRGEVGVVLLAVEASPREDLSTPGALYQTGWRSLADLERAADACKYGRMADDPPVEITIPSVGDPSLAPQSGSVVVAHVRYCAAETDPRPLIDVAVAGLQALWPEAADRVVGSRAWAPSDLERDFRLPGGHLEHGDWAIDQLLFLRPDARCRRGATPLDGLFVCGPGCHPGVGLHGGSAWWAAQSLSR